MKRNVPSKSQRSLNRHLLVGVLVCLLLVGGFGGWSAYARISGAVIAPGVIIVDGQRKQVQHKEGGIIGDILVKEGEQVAAGQQLIRLDDKLPRANLGIITKQSDKLMVRIARLSAERDRADKITFPPQIIDRLPGDPDLAAAVAGEKSLFSARVNIVQSQKQQTDERVARLKEEIVGLAAQRDAKKTEIDFIEEELSGLEKLHKQGHVTLTRIIALKRQRTRLKGELGQFIANIGAARGRIAEVKIQLTQFEQQALAEVARDLREAESSLTELQERRVVAEDQLKRLDINAPVAGIVHELQVHTIGGVIPPGALIMSLVPLQDSLFVHAQVSPTDIDQLHVGQRARIRFLAFNQRTTPEFDGTVDRVSADLSTDQNTGRSYYTVRLKYDLPEQRSDEEFQVVPGMPVEVLAQTADRTALSFLVKPVTDHLSRMFREE